MKQKPDAGGRPELIGRRDLLAMLGGAAVELPLATRAQQTAMPIVGVLSAVSRQTILTTFDAFQKGLMELGFEDGRNVAIEYRFADGHYDRLPKLAAELVRLKVSVINTVAGPFPVKAAMAATSDIPIVFSSGEDPVKAGFVASLNRPGGNVTGVMILSADVDLKRLGLLHQLLPDARSFGLLVNPNDQPQDRAALTRSLGVDLHVATTDAEFGLEAAFAELARARVDGVVVSDDAAFSSWAERIVALAAAYRLPTMYRFPTEVAAGGLISYGPNIKEAVHQVGLYVARILRGERPADLPVVEVTRFYLVINLKTANVLGLTIPPTLLATADEVVE